MLLILMRFVFRFFSCAENKTERKFTFFSKFQKYFIQWDIFGIHFKQVEWEDAVLRVFVSYFSYEWELPLHMSLLTQYTVVVCFGNLKLWSAVVPGSGAIIIPLPEKARVLHLTVCRFVHHYNCMKNRRLTKTTLFWTKIIYFVKRWKKIKIICQKQMKITSTSKQLV